MPVDVFGEFEFWFALIKVVALLGFWVFAICMNAGVGAQGYLGFTYWKSPGAFAPYLAVGPVAKFVGFWAVLIQAGFAFQGTELCAIGAGESANPRVTMPKAIRRTFWSIFTLFVFTIFFVGILVSCMSTFEDGCVLRSGFTCILKRSGLTNSSNSC